MTRCDARRSYPGKPWRPPSLIAARPIPYQPVGIVNPNPRRDRLPRRFERIAGGRMGFVRSSSHFLSVAIAVFAGGRIPRPAGGDGGIRTLDRALQPYNGLANRRLQPLGHISTDTTRRP